MSACNKLVMAVEEMGEIVRFLGGANSRWISGAVIVINGVEMQRAANWNCK